MTVNINGTVYYRTSEACRLCGISRATIFRWFATGVIDDIQCRDRKGWRLFTGDDISRITAEVKQVAHKNT